MTATIAGSYTRISSTIVLALVLMLTRVVQGVAMGDRAGAVAAQIVPEETSNIDGSTAETKPPSGLKNRLAKHGIEVGVGSTNIYQANVMNGLGTHQKAGRFSGSYDVEIAADLQQLLGLGGLGLFVHAEGGWPDTEGIDGAMVGSISGVNADAIGNRSLDVVEVIFEWSLLDDRLNLMAGKLDAAGFFDASEYANDEASQFLNGALVNNPTIPLPDYGLGVVVGANLTDCWSIAAGVVDAEADGREIGLRTTFDGEDYFFYALETGLATELDAAGRVLSGNYRLGLWYDPQPKSYSDGESEYRDDLGFYASVDQMLTKENEDPEDSQGLGVFARYGYADAKRNDVGHFWSIGFQYQGLVESRDDDVMGLGFAQGVFSDAASAIFTANHESVLEFYYSAQIAPWVAVSPGIQYLTHPGGTSDVSDALVVGVRAQIAF